MRHYTQLTIEQRYQISGLKKAGFNQSKIATDLNIHKSTISREIKRNKGQRGWRPRQAQEKAIERRQGCVNAKKFAHEDWLVVDMLVRQDLSPAQDTPEKKQAFGQKTKCFTSSTVAGKNANCPLRLPFHKITPPVFIIRDFFRCAGLR